MILCWIVKAYFRVSTSSVPSKATSWVSSKYHLLLVPMTLSDKSEACQVVPWIAKNTSVDADLYFLLSLDLLISRTSVLCLWSDLFFLFFSYYFLSDVISNRGHYDLVGDSWDN